MFPNNILRGIIEYPNLELNYWSIQKNSTTSLKHSFQILNGTINHLHKNDESYREKDYDVIHRHNNYISVNQAKNNNYRNIIFSRNPYDRALSMYKYLKNNPKMDKHIYGVLRKKCKTFFEFLTEVHVGKLNSNSGCLMFCSQSNYLEKDVEYTRVKLEELETLPSVLGISDFPFFYLNKTTKDEKVLDDKEIALINTIYEKDFLTFGYEMK